MRRLLFQLLLLVSLAFQGAGAAAQSRFGVAPGEHDHEHASLHLQDVAHHHHEDSADDGSGVVVDGTAESVSHLASDGALSAPAIPAMAPVVLAVAPAAAPPQWRQSIHISPDPQGLQRPPRLSL